ncbi:hypothetical protein GUJ93_ZPchr0008g12090 [Zizania palustris]|uniref:Uncharacterized protein n=1 Tax=Zizania palustris TaxID=103762 RepID=A0A8J5RL30_ZIZPA|nr:hypothetical protein GUJ93_ZPchr0008g12090 [Zizania palustris]
MAKRVARAFEAALSDIDSTSSEEPSSEEEEPPKREKKEKKEKKTLDITDLCFTVDDDDSSDKLETSEDGDVDRLSTEGDRGSSGELDADD